MMQLGVGSVLKCFKPIFIGMQGFAAFRTKSGLSQFEIRHTINAKNTEIPPVLAPRSERKDGFPYLYFQGPHSAMRARFAQRQVVEPEHGAGQDTAPHNLQCLALRVENREW